MAPASQNSEPEPFFGLIHGLSLGTLLLVSAVLAVPLHHFGWDWQALPFAAFNGVMWGVEVVLYMVLAFVMARHVLIALAGPVLGVVFRFILTFLIGLMVSAQSSKSLGDIFALMDEKMWIYRVLAIVMTGIIFLFPLRQTFISGFGLMAAPAPSKGGGTASKPKQFSFSSKAPHTGHYQVVRSSPQAAPAATAAAAAPVAAAAAPTRQNILTPPEGFTPVIPRDNVFGTVSVPPAVILTSVPEALPFLETDRPVAVHLAYLVPQMPKCTAWLLWNQIFSGNAGTAGGADAGIRDRWIRLSPKHYITQVPQEYFQLQRTPPAWMRLPEVPQEQQFHFDE